jgi:endoribonuclease Dicer
LISEVLACHRAESWSPNFVAAFFRNPWYIVAAVAFSASNKPEAVPQVFAHALEDLKSLSISAKPDDEKQLARKMREALFKSGLISGYPKVYNVIQTPWSTIEVQQAINSLRALSETMPEDLREKELLR